MKKLLLLVFAQISFAAYAQTGKVGINTNTPQAVLHVKDSSVLFSGAATLPLQPGNPPEEGQGIRMMWYPDKAAFRTGFIYANYGAKENIGNYSFATGVGTLAAGSATSALGSFTTASGANSSAFGVGTQANGFGSLVVGAFNHPVISNGQTSMDAQTPLFIVGNGDDNTSRNNAMLVTKAGKVGIGMNTVPQYGLHIRYSGDAGNDGHLGGLMLDATSTDVSEALISFRNAGSGGTGNNAWMLGLNKNRNFSFNYGNGIDAAGINKMVLDSTGRLGLGIPNPTEKLQVSGNVKADTIKPNAIKFTPNAGPGKVLVSDAIGNASWAANSATGNIGFGAWGDCATNANIGEYHPITLETNNFYDFARFGESVSISGNFAIVGASQDFISPYRGSASFYQFNGSNWVFMQKVNNSESGGNERFGSSVSISGNFAIVGDFWDPSGANSFQGSVSIYQFNGTNWILMQKIRDATGAANDFFGTSVSISGNFAIVGADGDDVGTNDSQGSASIYQFNGTNWVLMQKITDGTGVEGDFFGNSVSISGNYAIVGAKLDSISVNDQGSASIYKYNGTSWVLMQKIIDGTGIEGDRFGNSVSISGDYAIVGAPATSGSSGTSGSGPGSASIYRYNGTNWVLVEKIIEAANTARDAFGWSVSISGNYAVIGARYDDVGTNTDQGSASIYQRLGFGWQKLQFTSDPGGKINDYFGYSTAIDGNSKRFIIGALGYPGGKAVFGKIN